MRLPDENQRERIHSELDSCMLVEAAAGTGKTTSMVDRMVALLASGRCSVETLAAITFTRKAAAEMRERFQTKLEQQADETTGAEGERLAEAAENVGRAYIGTIHSFCARLLRERPVEAEVPLNFRELDEEEEARLQQEAWDTHCARLYARNDPILGRLAHLGVELADLESAFSDYVLYPDVEEWPSEPQMPLPGADEIEEELNDYLEHIKSLPEPVKIGSSEHVLKVYDELEARMRVARSGNLMSLAGVLNEFDEEDPNTCKTYWAGETREAKDELRERELARWEKFRCRVVEPFFKALHQHRYHACMEVLEEARQDYERRREEAGALNFQDLLLRAARLLREGGAHVRKYFQNRFTHLLVDEFQDTDPVQAEVMMLLTAQDPTETNWRACRPRPGSLFVVGDPKQSIYRFRRADLVTYNEVRRLIEQNGGEVVELSSNFRSTGPVIDWVNEAFAPQFPEERNHYSPGYVALEQGRDLDADHDEPAVQVLRTPSAIRKQSEMAEYEAGRIARYVRNALDDPMMIQPPGDEGEERPVRPADFLIITRTKKRMSTYAGALQRLEIPNQVTGGTVLNEVDALEQLHMCLAAVVRPHNPVAVVGVLRSELFGVKDPELLAFKEAGGVFDYRQSVPTDLASQPRERVQKAFEMMRQYARWMALLPPVAAARRVANDLGLPALAGASEGGNVEAGSLQKAFELMRDAQVDQWTAVDMVDYLGELTESEEQHDGLPALTMEQRPVRVMNLHKAKGLQAPIVFLADPSGQYQGDPALHIDRRGDATRGYMALQKQVNPYQRATIATPPNWEEVQEEERQFVNAEEARLRYVAATRAGLRLVISQREKPSDRNPWKPLAPYLEGEVEIEVEDCDYAAEVTDTISPEQHQAALGEIDQQWETVSQPTYDVVGAKERAVTGGEHFAGTRHGEQWGTVIHTLLERRMADPEEDIEALAYSAVRGEDLPDARAQEALTVVENVVDSEIWKRGHAAERCIPEAPFRRLIEDGERPVISRGVIDLAFKEDGAWVIVDYKTDNTEENEVGELVEHYKPQLDAYAAAWEECTGDRVKEAGLYFTRGARYVECR